jgi:hypothetical protein
MFWKRQRSESPAASADVQTWQPPDTPHFEIRFDDMHKGYLATRNGERIRQYCVYVDGASRLVTSGDIVDRATLDALVEAGVVEPSIKPIQSATAANNG